MRSQSSHQKQSGAALVVGLILLVVLTLMALASMNTASLDLIMVGNEQFRSRAFATAESGIELAIANTTFNTSADPAVVSGTTSAGDTYSYAITRPSAGAVQNAPSGNSDGTFGAVYFRVTSTGKSKRNAVTVSAQELFQVVKKDNEFVCLTPSTPSACGL